MKFDQIRSTTVTVPMDLHYQLKIQAAIEGQTIGAITQEAFYDWIAKVEKRRYAGIKSGVGTIGRSAKNPEAFKAALDALPKSDPFEED